MNHFDNLMSIIGQDFCQSKNLSVLHVFIYLQMHLVTIMLAFMVTGVHAHASIRDKMVELGLNTIKQWFHSLNTEQVLKVIY